MYIFIEIKNKLKPSKNMKEHTTISIPKYATEYIEPLRDVYSKKFGLPLTRGESVAKALEAEYKRNAK